MATFQQIINDARVLLNDQVLFEDVTPRYTETQLLGYAQQAITEARRIRPDLFLANLTGAFPTYTAQQAAPISDDYIVPLVDYVVARAEMRDDEFAVDGRAAGMFQKFKAGLLGV
jgi:hypothetical protein